jgi:hypothetical protein
VLADEVVVLAFQALGQQISELTGQIVVSVDFEQRVYFGGVAFHEIALVEGQPL